MADSTFNSQANQSSSGGGSGEAIGAISSAIGGIMGNLWSAKERKRSQEWNEKMYTRQVLDNRNNTDKAWQRETDIEYMMNQYKKAGINPYMVTGQSFNAPSASGGSVNATQQAHGDFGYIGQIPMVMAQQKLLQAQAENIQADTANKLAQTPYIGPTADQTIKNLQAMHEKLGAEVYTEKGKGTNMAIQNLIGEVEYQYKEAQQKIDIESKTQGNRLSQQNIAESKARIRQISATINHINSQIQQNTANLPKIKAEVEKLLNDVTSEQEMRPYNKANIDRSNMSIFAPVQKASQLIDSIRSKRR